MESWTLSLHDKAPRTLTHYLNEVWRFGRWLADHSRPAAAPGDLLAVERKDIEAWLMAQRKAGLSQATMRNRWVALRNLYGWALAEEKMEQPTRMGRRRQGEHPGARCSCRRRAQGFTQGLRG